MKVGLVKFMAVVDPTNQSRRAVAIVVGVTVWIEHGSCVRLSKLANTVHQGNHAHQSYTKAIHRRVTHRHRRCRTSFCNSTQSGTRCIAFYSCSKSPFDNRYPNGIRSQFREFHRCVCLYKTFLSDNPCPRSNLAQCEIEQEHSHARVCPRPRNMIAKNPNYMLPEMKKFKRVTPNYNHQPIHAPSQQSDEPVRPVDTPSS